MINSEEKKKTKSKNKKKQQKTKDELGEANQNQIKTVTPVWVENESAKMGLQTGLERERHKLSTCTSGSTDILYISRKDYQTIIRHFFTEFYHASINTAKHRDGGNFSSDMQEV